MNTPQIKPADFGKRIIAYLIDFMVISILSIGPMMVALSAYMISKTYGDPADAHSVSGEMLMAWAPILVTIVWLLALHIYVFLCEYISGKTLGKKLLGLKVVDLATHGPITAKQAFVREILRWTVDLGFIFPAILSMASSKARQRVGDKAAKTIVIQE